MRNFQGFQSKKAKNTPVPGQFFSELLPEIDDLWELKVSLYFLWRLDRMEGTFRYLTQVDISQDQAFMSGLGSNHDEQRLGLREALDRAVARGFLLQVRVKTDDEAGEELFFLNSPIGRAGVQGLQEGTWTPEEIRNAPITIDQERPNIFRLYEDHIGPLTPMLAERLRDAETSFPASWIEDAFLIAVENNVRRWRYIEAILKSWQEKGRDDRADRRDTQTDGRRYVEGEFSEFIEH